MADVKKSKLFQLQEGISQDALVVLVKTEWNHEIVNELEKGCLAVLHEKLIKTKTLVVPGAVEIPFAIQHYWNNAKKKNKPQSFMVFTIMVMGSFDL